MKAETTKDKSFEEWLSEAKRITAEHARRNEELAQITAEHVRRNNELARESQEIAREREYYDKIIAYYKMLYNNQERKDATLAYREV